MIIFLGEIIACVVGMLVIIGAVKWFLELADDLKGGSDENP